MSLREDQCPMCGTFHECKCDGSRESQQERLVRLLVNVAQLMDGWHQDGTAWTEWDEDVRSEVSDVLLSLSVQAARVKR